MLEFFVCKLYSWATRVLGVDMSEASNIAFVRALNIILDHLLSLTPSTESIEKVGVFNFSAEFHVLHRLPENRQIFHYTSSHYQMALREMGYVVQIDPPPGGSGKISRIYRLLPGPITQDNVTSWRKARNSVVPNYVVPEAYLDRINDIRNERTNLRIELHSALCKLTTMGAELGAARQQLAEAHAKIMELENLQP
jgi:hypothetical protein